MKPRRLLAMSVTTGVALCLTLTGCTTTPPEFDDPEFTIGSAVIVSHPALEAVQKGFEDVLNEQNIS